jgi:hypothetical protein
LGYLEEFPDYWIPGETEEEVTANLPDITITFGIEIDE